MFYEIENVKDTPITYQANDIHELCSQIVAHLKIAEAGINEHRCENSIKTLNLAAFHLEISIQMLKEVCGE